MSGKIIVFNWNSTSRVVSHLRDFICRMLLSIFSASTASFLNSLLKHEMNWPTSLKMLNENCWSTLLCWASLFWDVLFLLFDTCRIRCVAHHLSYCWLLMNACGTKKTKAVNIFLFVSNLHYYNEIFYIELLLLNYNFFSYLGQQLTFTKWLKTS